jgi:two-component system, OmpR family, phosphate regulon sensor histidine kinase PhoR
MSSIAPGRPVRSIMRIGFLLLLLTIAVGGVARITAISLINDRLNVIVDRLYPMASDNAAALQALTDAETGVRAYELTGETTFLEPYYSGMARYPYAMQRAVRLAPDRSSRDLLAAENEAAKRWISEFALPIVSSHSAEPASRVDTTTERGKRLFDEVRAKNGDVAAHIDGVILSKRATAQQVERYGFFGLTALTVIELGILVLWGLRLSRSIVPPLESLAATIDKLAAGDHGARAVEAGTAEVVKVAQAVNELAEEGERAAAEQERRVTLHALSATVARHVREHLELGPLLADSVAIVGRALASDRVTIRLAEDGEIGRVAADWTVPQMPPLGDRAERAPESWRRRLNEVAASGELYVVEDVASSPLAEDAEIAAYFKETSVRGIVVCPLQSGGELLGALSLVELRKMRAWDPADLALVKDVAADLSRGVLHSRLYEQQLQLVQELQNLDRAKSDFLSNVSHELRTPLTSISGYLELLEDEEAGPLSEQQQRILGVVERNAARLKDLIEDLLTLSRIEANAQKMTVEPVRLGDVINSAAATIEPSVASGGLAFEVVGTNDHTLVLADAGQLERVLLNLLNNAVKFTPEGGSVTISCHQTGDEVAVSVSDTGIGIPVADQPKLFSRFFRASNAVEKGVPGTGLGLTIVRAIVEGHRGRLEIRSAEGQGASFAVVLPVLQGVKVGPPSPANKPRAPGWPALQTAAATR